MKSLIALMSAAGLLMSTPSLKHLCNGILPENNMNIPVGVFTNGGITEADFNHVLDRVEKVFAKKIESKGAVLKIERNWADGTVNAFASQSGNEWMIAMFGGLARHREITADGFMLVACHELGHHIGGAPKYQWGDWASNEGQADYFATLKCMREVFGADDNQKIVSEMDVSPYVESSCAVQYRDNNEKALCVRLAYAGLSLSKLFAEFNTDAPPLNFETPYQRKVEETQDYHPDAQCRLDTYFAGSICPIPYTEEVSQSDARTGTCSDNSHPQPTRRPLCWFKP